MFIGRRKDVIFSYGKNILPEVILIYAVCQNNFSLEAWPACDNVSSEGEFLYLFIC